MTLELVPLPREKLRGLAQSHGGEFVDLVATDATDASARLRAFSVRLLAVEHDPEAVTEVFPTVDSPVTSHRCMIAGVLRAPETTVRLRVGHTEADAQTVTVRLVRDENPGALAARGWAAAKIDALVMNLAAHRAEVRRTGAEFGICTAGTSLIVLETLQDYARYRIDPPEELRANWKDVRLLAETGERRSREVHLEQLVWAWERKVAWWRYRFDQADVAPGSLPPQPDSGVPRPERLALMMKDVSTSSGVGPDWESVIAGDSANDETVVLSPFTVEATADGMRGSPPSGWSRSKS